jgi:hypothetical protein
MQPGDAIDAPSPSPMTRGANLFTLLFLTGGVSSGCGSESILFDKLSVRRLEETSPFLLCLMLDRRKARVAVFATVKSRTRKVRASWSSRLSSVTLLRTVPYSFCIRTRAVTQSISVSFRRTIGSTVFRAIPAPLSEPSLGGTVFLAFPISN